MRVKILLIKPLAIWQEEMNNKQKMESLRYCDQNGNVVSKEEYIQSCDIIENPKTGFKYISYLTIILVAILGICFYLIGKKVKYIT